jgi:aryl-alcohol dehydrogenase-like predicted oxidoreductase
MGRAIQDRRERVFLMTKLCTHGRKMDVAMQQLEESLTRLRTDYLDLWQIHECAYENDPVLHYAADGAVEALVRAREQGKVRFVGFTGHKHPSIHLHMLALGFEFDTVQMPLNCFDGRFRSFETEVLPELNRRGIAPIGMKALGGEGKAVKDGVLTAQEAYRYAMSLPVATTVVGIDSVGVLQQNLEIARGFTPMSDDEMNALRDRMAGLGADGRYELYKVSARFEGPIGREQHGFPPVDEVTL